MALLNESQIVQKLQHLRGWKYSNKRLEKEFEFDDFLKTLSFVTRVGEKAEVMNHHPDIFIHSYNKVKFMISTHSEGGVTDKDFELVDKIEELNK